MGRTYLRKRERGVIANQADGVQLILQLFLNIFGCVNMTVFRLVVDASIAMIRSSCTLCLSEESDNFHGAAPHDRAAASG